MKVTLYMAISTDGFIAKTDMGTKWVLEEDFAILDKKIINHGCVILWNTTFKEFGTTPWVINIIISTSPKTSQDNVYYVWSTKEAIELCTRLQQQNPLLIGGWITNGSFLKENLIDEIIIDIQPVILWKGIKIFEDIEKFVELEFVEHTPLEQWLNILRYKVKK